ncbi:Filamentation induced by cAMP protein Fic [Beggiatoa sp. PS]|nr:Filamentation induced by cAMP protein Fic [Beggiatoa sp. PS]
MKKLLDDFLVWMAFESFPVDEIAVRFHHRLVWILMFPNGNGRHARLMAYLILVSLSQPKFSWG